MYEDKYIFSVTEGKESSIEVYKKVNYVYKIDNVLFIQYKILFLNSNGIYVNSDFNNLLTNEKNNASYYINEGTSFEYEYLINYELENSYLLKNINKVHHATGKGV